MTTTPQTPGTVSKILWHFTGGPTWDSITNKQKIRPKSVKKAYENLKSIIETKELRVGNYREIVTASINRRVWNSKKRKSSIERNVRVQVESSQVCCLADIPAPHLTYHAYRYGQFAIGFHRSAAIRHGFNPVFYTLENAEIMRSIYYGFRTLSEVDSSLISSVASDIEWEISEVDDKDEIDVSGAISELDEVADDISSAVGEAHDSFQDLLALTKTFSQDEFASIYCEREWRSLKTFAFDFTDIAMIVVPRRIRRTNYYKYFVETQAPKLGLPRTIPIIPWEDLVEH